MKKYQRGPLAAMLALAAYSAVPAQASEVLNIPFSAAYSREDSPNNCAPNFGFGLASPAPAPVSCYLEFPLTVPVGRTIKQISVLHGTDEFLANPFIEAYVAVQPIAAPWGGFQTQLFYWSSNAQVASGTVASERLMAQTGVPPLVSYPDAFVTQSNRMYHVIMHLVNGAYVAGLQVTYD